MVADSQQPARGGAHRLFRPEPVLAKRHAQGCQSPGRECGDGLSGGQRPDYNGSPFVRRGQEATVVRQLDYGLLAGPISDCPEDPGGRHVPDRDRRQSVRRLDRGGDDRAVRYHREGKDLRGPLDGGPELCDRSVLGHVPKQQRCGFIGDFRKLERRAVATVGDQARPGPT